MTKATLKIMEGKISLGRCLGGTLETIVAKLYETFTNECLMVEFTAVSQIIEIS